jgi:hypothetical protein
VFVDEVDGVTDEQGVFLGERVPTGSVVANAAGFNWGVGSSLSPKLFERDCTRRIDVVAGRTTEVALAVYSEVDLNGRVVDPAGSPVAGATIWIAELGDWPSFGIERAHSDPAGRFHCSLLERAKWISAWAPGYAPAPAVRYDEHAHDGHAEIELQLLDRCGRVFGSAFDDAGRPVARAFVEVCGPWGQPRTLRDGTFGEQPPARRTRTRSDGGFDVTSAPLGSAVHLVVRAPGLAPAWKQFPLTANEERRIDVTLSAGGRLFGTLRTEDDQPLAGVEVRVGPPDGVPEPRSDVLDSFTRSDEAGGFELDHLPAGPLEASIDAGEHGTAKLSFEVGNGESREWDPELSRGAAIRGLVVDEHGAPCIGWKIRARLEKYEAGLEPPPDVSTDGAGRFTVSRCADRAYSLAVREPPPPGHYDSFFSDVVLRGVRPDREERRIEIPAAARPSAFLDGRVVDDAGQPIEQVALYLCQSGGGSDCVGENAGGARGFHLGPLPPGDYSMFLWKDGLPQIELGRKTLVADRALDLGALVLPTPGFADVDARRADGTEAEDGDIRIWSDELQDSANVSRIGDHFHSAPLAPGRYVLTGGQNMAAAWIPFDVAAGQTVKLSITVEPGAVRSFRLVTDAGGPPAAPVHVTVTSADRKSLWTRDWPAPGGGDCVISQRFAHGRFSISFRTADGKAGTCDFEVADLADAKMPVDVALH